MAGKPQRDKAKRSVQLRVDVAAYECLLPLLEGRSALRLSYSQLFESVLLLAKDEYVSNSNRDFVTRLCAVKKRKVDEEVRRRNATPQRNLHVTIDPEALGFLDMLVSRYRPLLHTRGKAASLILRLMGERIKTPEKTEWVKRRLEEILIKYPVRY